MLIKNAQSQGGEVVKQESLSPHNLYNAFPEKT